MSEPIIEVRNLTKAYRIWRSPSDRLKSPLLEAVAGLLPRGSSAGRALAGRATRGYRAFYALRDIAFTVRRGEATGIVGRNGSSKSTLLQLIAGTLAPTARSSTSTAGCRRSSRKARLRLQSRIHRPGKTCSSTARSSA